MFLLLGTIAAGSLVAAVKNAEEGYEDESGYHREMDRRNVAMG